MSTHVSEILRDAGPKVMSCRIMTLLKSSAPWELGAELGLHETQEAR
jgi:hypothetical protein